MPTVLQVIPSLGTGGAEQTTVDVARALVREGWTSIVVSNGGRLVEALERDGSEHITLPVHSKNPLVMIRNVRRLQQLIRSRGAGLVHARSRAPAWSCLAVCRMMGLPFVTTYHGAYNQKGRIKSLYNSVMARADRVIANSQWTADLIASRHPWAQSRLVVIPRGTDFAVFDPARIGEERKRDLAAQWGLLPGKKIILHLARLTGWKGQDVVIEAFASLAEQFPDFDVVLAGDDQGRSGYREQLEQKIRKLGLEERIHLPGHCSDPGAAMALASIAVVPSTEPEAFGRAAVEAEAMGALTIVSDLGAVRETVLAPPLCDETGRTGWLIPPGDAVALAETLRMAMSLPESERLEIAARARRHCLENFSLEQMVSKTLAVYRDLLD